MPKAGTGRDTVGGRYVFHHMIWSTRVLSEVPENAELTAGARAAATATQSRRGPCTKSAATPTCSTSCPAAC